MFPWLSKAAKHVSSEAKLKLHRIFLLKIDIILSFLTLSSYVVISAYSKQDFNYQTLLLVLTTVRHVSRILIQCIQILFCLHIY